MIRRRSRSRSRHRHHHHHQDDVFESESTQRDKKAAVANNESQQDCSNQQMKYDSLNDEFASKSEYERRSSKYYMRRHDQK